MILLGDLLLLAFLAYGPWHGTQTLGSIHASGVEIAGLKNISVVGMYNFAWIVLLSTTALLPFIFEQVKNKSLPLKKLKFLLIPLVFAILNSNKLDSLTVVSLENWWFVTLLSLTWFCPMAFRVRFKLFSKWALPTLTVSYLLALLLPFCIEMPGHLIWSYFYPIVRYVGWHGEGAPYATVGMILTLLAVFEDLTGSNKKWTKMAVIAGLCGILLNVQRISMLAACMAIFFVGIRTKKQAAPILVLATFCLGSLFIGPMAEKAKRYTSNTNVWKTGSIDLSKTQLEDVISTSGRLGFAKLLLSEAPQNHQQTSRSHSFARWLGLGTGSAPRLLRVLTPKGLEPNSDFVRVLTEHGLVGFIFFLIFLGLLGHFSWGSLGFASWLAILTMMIGENALVLPAYVSGPLWLVGILGNGILADLRDRKSFNQL